MKKLVAFGILVLVLLVMVVTVPSRDDHMDTIRTSCTSVMKDSYSQNHEFSDDNNYGQLGLELGNMLVSGILNLYLDSNFRTKNYFFFNKGIVTYDGEDKTISVGVLGHVFFLGEDKLKETFSNSESVKNNWKHR